MHFCICEVNFLNNFKRQIRDSIKSHSQTPPSPFLQVILTVHGQCEIANYNIYNKMLKQSLNEKRNKTFTKSYDKISKAVSSTMVHGSFSYIRITYSKQY